MTYKEGYKLFEDTYLCVFDKCLVIAKVDKDGKIIKVSTFGENPTEIPMEKEIKR